MQRLLVQKALRAAVLDSRFFQVKYDPITKDPIIYDPLTEPLIVPSIEVNEINGKFEFDRQHGSGLVLKQTTWTFELYLTFQVETDLEAFEENMRLNPPYILATGSLPWVRLIMHTKAVQHPAQQDATTGTEAKYLFQAELGRA